MTLVLSEPMWVSKASDLEPFLLPNISSKSGNAPQNASDSHLLPVEDSNFKSFIIIAQLVSWVNRVSSLVSGENASGCPGGE